MKDIRVYEYGNGGLSKSYHLKKSYPSINEAKEAILKLKSRLRYFDLYQWVIVEYTGKYQSKIIEVFNINENK